MTRRQFRNTFKPRRIRRSLPSNEGFHNSSLAPLAHQDVKRLHPTDRLLSVDSARVDNFEWLTFSVQSAISLRRTHGRVHQLDGRGIRKIHLECIGVEVVQLQSEVTYETLEFIHRGHKVVNPLGLLWHSICILSTEHINPSNPCQKLVYCPTVTLAFHSVPLLQIAQLSGRGQTNLPLQAEGGR